MSKQKQKGTSFEQAICDYLNEQLNTDEFHRLALHGVNDVGDIAGLYSQGQKVVIEAKNHKALKLAKWIEEAEKERGNADALAVVVVHKRKGKGKQSFGETYVTMTLDNLLSIITGEYYGA